MPRTSRRARFGRSTAVCAPGLGLALGLALAQAGCDHVTALLEEKAQAVAEEIAPPEGAAPPAGPVLSDDEQLAVKLALYTECRGRASRRMRQSWQRYTEHVKEDDGTPRRDKDGKLHEPFLYEIHGELTPCEEAVAKGPVMAPSLPEIEATMATWLDHAKAFAAATVELDVYYEKETYATDDWARGKELAPGFLAAWQGWSKADDELAALVEVRLDVVERALLTQLEARTGKDLEWHARTVVLRAKELARCVSGPPATEPTEATEADTAEPAAPARPSRGKPALACDEPLEAVRTAAAEFRRSYDADRTRADAVFWMSAFEASVTDFVAEAERVIGKPPKGGPTPEQIAKLLDERDDLVSDAANLRFDR
jgi:hypothetical protein